MEEIVESVFQYKETWVRASHGVSKTMTAAALTELWLSVYGWPVVTTAPSSNQVNNLLWRQIRINRLNAQVILPGELEMPTGERRELPGAVQQTPNIKIPGRDDWFAKGFTTDKPDRAQGPHLDNLLIIVDEAAGMKDWFMDAIKGWMTNPNNHMLCIGNPNTLRNKFWSAFNERMDDPDVNAIHISAHDSPNVTFREDDTPKPEEEIGPHIPGLADDDWILARRREWGKGSILYKCKVLGEMPDDIDSKALPLPWCKAASAKSKGEPAELEKLALDVARAGKDKNALGGLELGGRVRLMKYWDQPDTTKTAETVALFIREMPVKPACLIIDANGVGGPVFDMLKKTRRSHPDWFGRCQVVDLDWGATADDPKRFKNVVSELYHRVRDLVDPNKPDAGELTLPSSAECNEVGLTWGDLLAQLSARKCGYDDSLRFWVESKTQLARRVEELGKASSPDLADMIAALMYKPIIRRIIYASA